MFFKHQYYCFVAGLPDFSFESTKLPFTVEEFKTALDDELKPEDKRLLAKYFLKYDNDNLLNLLKNKDFSSNSLNSIPREEMLDAVEKLKENQPVKNKNIPAYQQEFIKIWLKDDAQNENRQWEDLMSSLYMDYGIEVKNSFISRWFELNLNIGNLLSAIYAKKYGMDVSQVIVGSNPIAQKMRENAAARDFGISQDLEYFDTIQRISEETDIYERERKIDKYRWDWLEENSVFDYFNIEYIFAYLCKLRILERWVNLNAEEGERIFRELISNLKSEIKMPEE